MRNIIFLLSSVVLFALVNYAIYEKELVKEQGEVVLLELVPLDPRSLMQGDFMRLGFAIERSADVKVAPRRGYLVIAKDAQGIGRFVRVHQEEPLAAGEKLVHFVKSWTSAQVVPNSFMFQEGHAAHYSGAKYGIFKFAPSGDYLLTGLADDRMQEITPKG